MNAQRSRDLVTPTPIDISKLTLPECDIAECDDAGPFMIRTEAGPVNRCRNCLRKDLAANWWRYE